METGMASWQLPGECAGYMSRLGGVGVYIQVDCVLDALPMSCLLSTSRGAPKAAGSLSRCGDREMPGQVCLIDF